ncbi:ASCH domain-containing protein [Staphylococcus condimenti]|uniref:ASCH domain-containing protein n=1 Tax=Staphylococcus condimenti TaxID=70255 RepID=A0A143PAV2_9STAP|nr:MULTISPECIES: ASCH domain-containing protein [Staphylococcus]AMY05661.1 RNA-binding protein [Staphylococcus condimenti]OFP00703.1 RNA-binding protein [Staphylococcus sp. HMSC065E08]PNZ63990.1 ASCH domain-containing protein [Staphylococcus condimenti]QQS82537.1 ASCH domain-containing protein [Staphylococcus condimenti]QRP95031.1 ASCH domain-containing protein [Staphylococcus condimenti]
MAIEEYWKAFVSHYPEYQNKPYTAWQFGVDPSHLADLVKRGIKTATTSGLAFYTAEQEHLPKVGDLSIVLDAQDNPICIIKNTNVYQVPFSEVSEMHAYKEGEGDRTLSYWRTVHTDFFEKEFNSINQSFSEEETMVCEEFECIYVLN